MPSSVTLLVLAGLVFNSCALYVIYYRFFHRLAKFPGPILASFSNTWKAHQIVSGKFEYRLLEEHRKHGPIIRIGPNHLNISDAAAVKGIYGSGRAFAKSSFYDAFTALRPNLFGVRDEEIHSARRKALAQGFSLQSVFRMEEFIDNRLQKLIARLDCATLNGETVDLKQWISFFVLDVLGELAFSQPFGILESADEKMAPPIREHVLLATVSGQMPRLIPYINKVVPYLPIPALQKMIKGRQGLRKMAISSVNRRVSNDSGRKDLLGNLIGELRQGVDSKGRTLDIVDIQTEAFGFIVAGSHTTAASTTLLFWHLFNNSDTFAKLEAEIEQVPPPLETPCYPFGSVSNLPYLQAAVTENFRISPVFVMPLMRVVPEGGKVIGGEFVPQGTDVSICNYVLHHDESVFGPDLERFSPERWLDDEYDKLSYLIAFGAGHRACIGRNIANIEIYKLVATLISRYEFTYMPQEKAPRAIPRTRSFGVADLDESVLVKLRLKRRPSSQ